MPTPSSPEPTALPELPSDTHSAFASCPPEENRDPQTSRGSRWPAQPNDAAAGQSQTSDDEHMISQENTPEPETLSTSHRERQEDKLGTSADERSAQVDEAGGVVMTDAPTPSADSQAGESDARLAQSMSATAISQSPSSEYLSFPLPRHRHLTNSTSSFLYPGAKFRGTQQSDRQVYDVQVEIKDVDMAESFLCGYLRIQGLTDDHPTLTTFFEGEIIGPKYLFRTTHASWGSSEKVDLQHWARFPAWRPLAKSAKSPNFTLKNFQQREHIFMRWKEYFLVPDHRVKTITGASFEGFYYICFNQCTGSVSGIYFHAKSEKYQQLELQHVDDKGCMGSVEFR